MDTMSAMRDQDNDGAMSDQDNDGQWVNRETRAKALFYFRHIITCTVIVLLSVFLLIPEQYGSGYDLDVFIICVCLPIFHFIVGFVVYIQDYTEKYNWFDDKIIFNVKIFLQLVQGTYAFPALVHFIVGIVGFAGNYNKDIVIVSQVIALYFCFVELIFWSHLLTKIMFMRFMTLFSFCYLFTVFIVSCYLHNTYYNYWYIVSMCIYGIMAAATLVYTRDYTPFSGWAIKNVSTISSSMTKTTASDEDDYLSVSFGTVILFVSGVADMTTDLWYAVDTDFERPILFILCWTFIVLQIVPQLFIGIKGMLLLLSTKKLIPWSIYVKYSEFEKTDLFKFVGWVLFNVIWLLVVMPLWILFGSFLYLMASVTKLVSIENVPIAISNLLVIDSETPKQEGTHVAGASSTAVTTASSAEVTTASSIEVITATSSAVTTESSDAGGWKGKLRVKRSVFNGMVLIETFLESLPQLAVTIANTALSNEGFTDIGIATVSVSGFVLLNTVYKIGYNVFVKGRTDIKDWEL